jgi:hypothetical protein
VIRRRCEACHKLSYDPKSGACTRNGCRLSSSSWSILERLRPALDEILDLTDRYIEADAELDVETLFNLLRLRGSIRAAVTQLDDIIRHRRRETR